MGEADILSPLLISRREKTDGVDVYKDFICI